MNNMEIPNIRARIKWAEHKILSAEKSFEFWQKTESDLKNKYKNAITNRANLLHIRAVKVHRKSAKNELLYWQAELNALQKKLFTYQLLA